MLFAALGNGDSGYRFGAEVRGLKPAIDYWNATKLRVLDLDQNNRNNIAFLHTPQLIVHPFVSRRNGNFK